MAAALLAQLAALEADLPLAARLEAARPPPVTIFPKDDDERPLMREPPPQRPLMREPTPHHVKQTPTASFVAYGSRHPPLAAAAMDTADGMAQHVQEASRSPRARPRGTGTLGHMRQCATHRRVSPQSAGCCCRAPRKDMQGSPFGRKEGRKEEAGSVLRVVRVGKSGHNKDVRRQFFHMIPHMKKLMSRAAHQPTFAPPHIHLSNTR